MLRVLSVVACTLMLAGCQTSGQRPMNLAPGEFEQPVPTGHTRVRLARWDRERWQSRQGDTFTAAKTIFQCRPLACPGATNVVYSRSSSPTRKPDPTALARLAADRDSTLSSDGWTITSSHLTNTRGYPTLQREARKELNGRMIYSSENLMFVGNMAINVTSNSEDAGTAHRSRDEFSNALEVKDGGPRPLQ